MAEPEIEFKLIEQDKFLVSVSFRGKTISKESTADNRHEVSMDLLKHIISEV